MPRAIFSTLAFLMAAACPAMAADLAIVDARIYPTPDSAPIERGTVLVRGGSIASVGPSATLTVPDGATVINAKGAVGFLGTGAEAGGSATLTLKFSV